MGFNLQSIPAGFNLQKLLRELALRCPSQFVHRQKQIMPWEEHRSISIEESYLKNFLESSKNIVTPVTASIMVSFNDSNNDEQKQIKLRIKLNFEHQESLLKFQFWMHQALFEGKPLNIIRTNNKIFSCSEVFENKVTLYQRIGYLIAESAEGGEGAEGFNIVGHGNNYGL